MASPIDDTGAATTTKFTDWVSERQKASAQIMKQSRQDAGEREGQYRVFEKRAPPRALPPAT